ncbi:hypothetical protein [Paenibacillus sp. GCM10023250]|uniref:hypothetical protein n=1 Tax=Paenibacillus sp. GCM10023250 TaxID=3252648 RepID=UPI00361732DC
MITARQLIALMEETLRARGFDLAGAIDELGQVRQSVRRERGEAFSFGEHIRGMLLALLSNQRPWGPIARNEARLAEIFGGYEAERLKAADKSRLAECVKAIKCGNRAIARQMADLDANLATLERIAADYGSLDRFVLSGPPEAVARELGQGKRYKLRGVGFTLALEYLRHVGVKAIKPDLHIRRIVSDARLRLHDGYPSEDKAVAILGRLAAEAGVNLTYLDNLMWLYCAADYGAICGAAPKCGACGLRPHCAQGRAV